jgi:hypothetical protein
MPTPLTILRFDFPLFFVSSSSLFRPPFFFHLASTPRPWHFLFHRGLRGPPPICSWIKATGMQMEKRCIQLFTYSIFTGLAFFLIAATVRLGFTNELNAKGRGSIFN